MTLHDYLVLMEDGYELTVWDKDYDIEVYFYNDDDDGDLWSKCMAELSKLLDVREIRSNGVIVNLSEVIENKLEALKNADLFIRCDIDSIMDDIENIISGYVSEEWMEIFVNVLKYDYYFEAIETCPHCDKENVYPMWNVSEKGYVAICQHCGEEILLCDECIHAEDGLNTNCMGCDWCETKCGGKCFRGSTKNSKNS